VGHLPQCAKRGVSGQKMQPDRLGGGRNTAGGVNCSAEAPISVSIIV
ncbi:hypothetical protein NPIL_24961, partial [Nephila pilipes]